MNILFLLRLWPVYGGGETVTICLANEMVRRGYGVTVAYFKEATKEQMPFIDERVKAVRLDGVDTDEFHCFLEAVPRVRQQLVALVKEQGFDVVINQWWPVEYIDTLKRECPEVKVVKCHHTTFFKPIFDDPNPVKRIAKQVLRPLYLARKKHSVVGEIRQMLPCVDKYVFLSPAFQREFEAMAKYDNAQGKLDSIPNPTVYDHWASPESLARKENVVLVVGRMLEGQKKITRILTAWHEIERSGKADGWRLEIVGEGPDLPGYKEMAASLGLSRVSFEGYQQPLPYYHRAKIFLMTSAFEGFGMTLVESHQNGVVPVVMDSFASLHDIVKDGYNGRIVKEGDIPAFVGAVIDLMEHGDRCTEMARHGLETSRLFGVEKVVDRWMRLFSGMMENKGG